MMLVIGNCGNTGAIPIRLDLKRLGFTRIQSARNAETGAALKLDGDKVLLPIKKHDLALVEMVFAGR